MPIMKKVLYPVKQKFIIKQHTGTLPELEKYTGLVYEYYNMMPWSSESYGRSSSMWFRMACSYINFSSVTYDFGDDFTYTEQDEFGMSFQRVNCEGENTVYGGPLADWTWEQRQQYEKAHGGGKGAVVSAVTPYRYGGWTSEDGEYFNDTQPSTFVGSKCSFVELSGSDKTSGAENTWEFGWMGAKFTGNCLYTNERSKDMVMWIYDLAYDTGFGHYELDVEGVPDNGLFLPGQRGWRKISNEYKYAPWERYPSL